MKARGRMLLVGWFAVLSVTFLPVQNGWAQDVDQEETVQSTAEVAPEVEVLDQTVHRETDESGNAVDVFEVEFTIPDQLMLCPYHVGSGDRDFKGHGPECSMSAGLSVDGQQIKRSMYLRCTETQADWTKGERTWPALPVYTIPAGCSFDAFLTDNYSSCTYTDTDHDLDLCSPSGGLVDQFWVNGDTGGNDVGNCTTDDTYMNVYFDTVGIRYSCVIPCIDNDHDTWGNPASPSCPHTGLDCNDNNPQIHPGAPEIPNSCEDENCGCSGNSGCGDTCDNCATFPVQINSAMDLLPYFALFLVPLGYLLVMKRRVRRRR